MLDFARVGTESMIKKVAESEQEGGGSRQCLSLAILTGYKD